MTVVINGTSGITDVNGSAAAPAITGTDTDTGVFFGTNTVSLSTGGTERLQVDSSGNLGLGVTPSVWGTYSGVLDLKGNGALAAYNQSINLSANSYYNGTNWIYKATTSAGQYQIAGSVHQWYTAASGTAGNAITFTQAMTLDASGNLGIGTTSPSFSGSSRRALTLNAPSGQLSILEFGVNGSLYGYLYANATETTINAGGGTSATSPLTFQTNGAERARIDSSGRAGFGYSSPNANFVIGGAGGSGWITGARNTLQLRNVNSSSNQSNYIAFGSAGTDVSCSILNDINANGTTVNQLNIQAGTSGGVYLANGGTSWTAVSDERYKDIIEPITDAASKVSALRAVIGKYKVDADGIRRSFLIAQDVKAVLPEAVTNGEDPQGNEQLGLSYSDVIPLLVAAIKEQQNIITQLQADVAALKAKA